MSRAISSGALESSTTCTLPAPVSITGTVELVTTVSIRFADPRGTSTSMRPRAVIIAFAPIAAELVDGLDRLGVDTARSASAVAHDVDQHGVR